MMMARFHLGRQAVQQLGELPDVIHPRRLPRRHGGARRVYIMTSDVSGDTSTMTRCRSPNIAVNSLRQVMSVLMRADECSNIVEPGRRDHRYSLRVQRFTVADRVYGRLPAMVAYRLQQTRSLGAGAPTPASVLAAIFSIHGAATLQQPFIACATADTSDHVVDQCSCSATARIHCVACWQPLPLLWPSSLVNIIPLSVISISFRIGLSIGVFSTGTRSKESS